MSDADYNTPQDPFLTFLHELSPAPGAVVDTRQFFEQRRLSFAQARFLIARLADAGYIRQSNPRYGCVLTTKGRDRIGVDTTMSVRNVTVNAGPGPTAVMVGGQNNTMQGSAVGSGTGFTTTATRIAEALRQDAARSNDPNIADLADSCAREITDAAHSGDRSRLDAAIARVSQIVKAAGPVFTLTSDILKTITSIQNS